MGFLEKNNAAGRQIAGDNRRLLFNLGGVRMCDPSDVPGAKTLSRRGRGGGRDGTEDVPQRDALAEVRPGGAARERHSRARRLPKRPKRAGPDMLVAWNAPSGQVQRGPGCQPRRLAAKWEGAPGGGNPTAHRRGCSILGCLAAVFGRWGGEGNS
eukprot:1390392-Alexandrium_andersonii.AAC.1